MFFRLILALVLAMGFSPVLQAAPVSAEDQRDIARVEAYLNSITTLRASFVQTSTDSGVYKGMIYVKRPGRMRIDYDMPNGNFVVADGAFIYFWDAELKQQTNAPLGTTLADMILRKDLRLSGEIKVTGIVRSANQLDVTLAYADDPGQGNITLIFDANPLLLKKWVVVDAQGQTTEVALINPETGVTLPSSLFHFRNPKFYE